MGQGSQGSSGSGWTDSGGEDLASGSQSTVSCCVTSEPQFHHLWNGVEGSLYQPISQDSRGVLCPPPSTSASYTHWCRASKEVPSTLAFGMATWLSGPHPEACSGEEGAETGDKARSHCRDLGGEGLAPSHRQGVAESVVASPPNCMIDHECNSTPGRSLIDP